MFILFLNLLKPVYLRIFLMFSANSSENVDFVAAISLAPVYMPQILLHNPKSLFISTYVHLSHKF